MTNIRVEWQRALTCSLFVCVCEHNNNNIYTVELSLTINRRCIYIRGEINTSILRPSIRRGNVIHLQRRVQYSTVPPLCFLSHTSSQHRPTHFIRRAFAYPSFCMFFCSLLIVRSFSRSLLQIGYISTCSIPIEEPMFCKL